MATNTYTAIAQTTVTGSTTADVSFTNISGYSNIIAQVVLIPTGTGNALRAQVNNDASTIYSRTVLYVGGATIATVRNTGMPDITGQWGIGSGSAPLFLTLRYHNYASSNFNKIILWEVSDTSGTTVARGVSLYPSNTPITQINFKTNGGYFAVGSTFSLYGIAAEGITAKATGGTIYSDSTYFYHVFPSSGTFTPTQSLSADVLVVAGGGGGGADDGGAGGGGGVAIQSARSLTATGYTVTVGAGGGFNAGAASNGSNSGFDTITATGGGAGGTGNVAGGRDGSTGGSGGGGSYRTNSTPSTGGVGGSGTTGTSGGATLYGYSGGNGSSTSLYGGGGGGGAGGAGGNGSTTAGGAGGIGRTDSFINAIGVATGVGHNVNGSYYFAGGGGGSVASGGTAGAGGYGGGASGGNLNAPAAAKINTGGGGGSDAGSGGSGIVVIRYLK